MSLATARAMGFDVALWLALVLGVLGHLLWGEQPILPVLRLPIPMISLFPVLTSLLLTWPLLERWPQFIRAVSCHPYADPCARFLATQTACMLASTLAGLGDGAMSRAVAVSSIGASTAALLAPLFDRYLPFAMLPLGYLWLDAVVRYPSHLRTSDLLVAAVVSLPVSAVVFVAGSQPAAQRSRS